MIHLFIFFSAISSIYYISLKEKFDKIIRLSIYAIEKVLLVGAIILKGFMHINLLIE